MNVDQVSRILVTAPMSSEGVSNKLVSFFQDHQCPLLSLEQQSPPEEEIVLCRAEFKRPPNLSLENLADVFEKNIGKANQIQFNFYCTKKPKNMVVLVSKHEHALLDILERYQRNQWNVRITRVISNHETLRSRVEDLGIPFVVVPVNHSTKAEAEKSIHRLIEPDTDLIVLARYMQILSDDFVRTYPSKIINIHHSFLPAFKGADPYRQAFERGVKLIGATAHYATAELDEGPIIEQDANRVSHRYSVSELKDIGRDMEKTVLARAVKWHLEDRIILLSNKTYVFYH